MYDAKICVIFLINLFLFLRFVEMFLLPTSNTKSRVSPIPGSVQGQFGWGPELSGLVEGEIFSAGH